MKPLLMSREEAAKRDRAEKERNEREQRVRRENRHNVMKRASKGSGNGHPTVSKVARVVVAEDGVMQTDSGNAIVVTVRDNAAGRRELARHCEREGITASPLTGVKTVVTDADTVDSLTEFAKKRSVTFFAPLQDGTYNRRTGKEIPAHRRKANNGGTDGVAEAEYLCVGEPEALWTLLHHSVVLSWKWKESHHIPFKVAGSGPEKVRPSMGSTFGRPGQILRTAETLAKYTSDRVSGENAALRRAKEEAGYTDAE